MLFQQQTRPGSGVDIEQIVGELPEAVDVGAFRQAWESVHARHDVFRVGFTPSAATLGPAAPPEWVELDAAADLNEYLATDRRRGFDLARPPLSRVAVAGRRFVWTVHHLILDGRAFPIVLREVFETLAAGRPAGPAPSYVDHLRRQAGRDPAAHEPFWREYLRGFAAPTRLPVDAGPGREGGHAEHELHLPAEVADGLRAVAAVAGATPNNAVQAAWAYLLHRHSGDADVLFGTARACRHGDPGTVGLFMNTVPLRVRVPTDHTTVGDWLRQLREQHVALRPVEDSPLLRVRGWAEVPGTAPLFDSLLMFDRASLDEELREHGRFRLHERTGVPLTLSAYLGTGLTLRLNVDRGRFADADAARLLDHLGVVLRGIAAGTDGRVADLPLMGDAEFRRVTAEYPDGGPARPGPGLLHGRFEEQVRRTPEAVAVEHPASGVRLTYRELNDRADALAARLAAAGVTAGDRVGVCVARTPELVVSLYGVLKAGGAYVPLDPAYPARRLAFMLADCGAKAVVADERGAAVVAFGGPVIPASGGPASSALSPLRERAASRSEAREGSVSHEEPLTRRSSTGCPLPQRGEGEEEAPRPDDLAYLIYTSGSTGVPKGVPVEHRSAAEFVGWAAGAFSAEDLRAVLGSTSAGFDVSVFELFAPLAVGGRVVLVENVLAPLPDGVTLMATVPSAAAEVARAGRVPASVRTLVLAGEALSAEVADELYARTAVREVRDLYGPTEATVYATGCVRRPGDPATIGRPRAGVRAHVLDGLGRPCPVGVPGELWLAGGCLARGYWGRDELTADRFPGLPAAVGGGRGYKTGDRARWRADGAIEYLGRLDHQVKVRGFRVELGEVESALRKCSGVGEAVAGVRGDGPAARLVAWVVPTDGADPPAAVGLRQTLAEALPAYLVPAAVGVIAGWPRTTSGKIDRNALPDPGAVADRPAVALTPTEAALAAVWAEVLGGPLPGPEADFFAAGGQSLAALRLVARVRQTLGAELPVGAVFDRPTLAGMAAALIPVTEDDDPEPAPAVVDVDDLSPEEVERLLRALS